MNRDFPYMPPCAKRSASVVQTTTDLVERYGYVARAYAQGRLCECLYECDDAGVSHWEAVARKLDILAERAPDLLSIATYLSQKAPEGKKALKSPPHDGYEPRIA